MNQTEVLEALSQISDTYILEAATPPRKKTLTFRRGIAFAAAVAAVLALVLGIPFLNRDNEIVTLPGVITVKAYSPDSSSPAFIEKYEGVELEKDTVDFDTTRPHFSMFYNFHPGILLSISLPEEYGDNITYRVLLPTPWCESNYIGKYLPEDFRYEYYYHYKNELEDLVFQNNDAIACIFWSEEPHEYIQFFVYDGDYLIGYIVVKACKVDPASNSLKYTAHVLDAVYFPKVNGKRQHVSMNYVNQQIAALIGQE